MRYRRVCPAEAVERAFSNSWKEQSWIEHKVVPVNVFARRFRLFSFFLNASCSVWFTVTLRDSILFFVRYFKDRVTIRVDSLPRTYFALSENLRTVPRFRHDDQLYEHFRQVFPSLKVSHINEDRLKTAKAQKKWRPFLEQYKGVLKVGVTHSLWCHFLCFQFVLAERHIQTERPRPICMTSMLCVTT